MYFLKNKSMVNNIQPFGKGAICGTLNGDIFYILDGSKQRIAFTIKICHSPIKIISKVNDIALSVIVVSETNHIYYINFADLKAVEIESFKNNIYDIESLVVNWNELSLIICTSDRNILQLSMKALNIELSIIKSVEIYKGLLGKGMVMSESGDQIFLRSDSSNGKVSILGLNENQWNITQEIQLESISSIDINAKKLFIGTKRDLQIFEKDEQGQYKKVKSITGGVGLVRNVEIQNKKKIIVVSIDGVIYSPSHKLSK